MKFLSRIAVDRKTAAQRRFMDSYAWHQALWKAFPGQDERSFLFRIEDKASGFQVFLLSEVEPEAQEWGRWETKPIAPSFLGYDRYRFQLRANPTVKRKRENRKNGTRTAIYGQEELAAWLERKAQQGGFSVEQLQIGPPLNQPFRKSGRRGNHKRVDFEGILSVTDREQLTQTFSKGIGSAKAFGFGLLVLQPINQGE